MKKLSKNAAKTKILGWLIVSAGLGWFLLLAREHQLFSAPSNSPQSSSDAIALRVIPNPDHLSPGLWYYRQGFNGSPQALTVDGYDAVRDGRTVYVNAG